MSLPRSPGALLSAALHPLERLVGRLSDPRPAHFSRAAQILLSLGSLAGYAFMALLLMGTQNVHLEGGLLISAPGGNSSAAYWLAGQNWLAGIDPYAASLSAVDTFGGFYYPPVLLPLFGLFSLIPLVAAIAISQAAELLALRFIAGSWRATGWWLLALPVVQEIKFGNVNLLVSAGVVLALRGAPLLLPLAALPKFAPGLAVPAAWRLHPGARPGLYAGLGLVALAGTASYLLVPGLWASWVHTLLDRQAHEAAGSALSNDWDGSWPLRLVLALVLALLPLWKGWPWPRSSALLATIISLTALRTVSFAGLAALPALIRQDALGQGAAGQSSSPAVPPGPD